MYILEIVVCEIMLNVCMWMVSEILRENWIFSRFPTYQKLKASGDNWNVIKEPKLPQSRYLVYTFPLEFLFSLEYFPNLFSNT